MKRLMLFLLTTYNVVSMDITPSTQEKQNWTSAKEFAKQYGYDTLFALMDIANIPPCIIEQLKIRNNTLLKVVGAFYQEPFRELFTLEQWQMLGATNTLQRIERYRLDSLYTWQQITEEAYVKRQNKIPKQINQAQECAPLYRSKKCSWTLDFNLPDTTFYVFQHLPSYEAPERINSFNPHESTRSGLIQSHVLEPIDGQTVRLIEFDKSLPKIINIFYTPEKSLEDLEDPEKRYTTRLQGSLNVKRYSLDQFCLKEIVYRTQIANGNMLQDLLGAKFANMNFYKKKRFIELAKQQSHNHLKIMDVKAYVLDSKKV